MRDWYRVQGGGLVPGRRHVGFAPRQVREHEPRADPEQAPTLWAGHEESNTWYYPYWDLTGRTEE